MNHILADIAIGSGGSGLVHDLFFVLIIGICLLLLWAAGSWACGKLSAPPIVLTVWTGFFLLVGLIIVLNFLLALTGHGFISY